MARDFPVLAFGVSVVLLVFAVAAILFVVIAPTILGGSNPDTGSMATLQSLLPVAAMVAIILGFLFSLLTLVLFVYEIAVSKNSEGWKVIWISIVVAFWLVGTAAYIFYSRKDRLAPDPKPVQAMPKHG